MKGQKKNNATFFFDDAEEDGSDDSDSTDFVSAPIKLQKKMQTKSETQKYNNAVVAIVENNTLQKNSLWKSQSSALGEIKVSYIRAMNAAHSEIRNGNVVVVHAGGLGNKNGLQINCNTDGKVSRKQAKCSAHCIAHEVKKGEKEIGRITSINMVHNCSNNDGRKQNTYVRLQGATWGGVAPTEVSIHGMSKGTHRQDGVHMTYDQSYRLRKKANKDSYDDWIVDLAYRNERALNQG